ncbi:MAG: hypothetical protein JW863_15800 [Chitinispirillaceae bacterium]|nr:hypothetical protein [Chitinispirillaceae bacterium]
MPPTKRFGNPQKAEKLVARFGTSDEPITVEMKYSQQVTDFLDKIEKAHSDAAKSTLVFN